MVYTHLRFMCRKWMILIALLLPAYAFGQNIPFTLSGAVSSADGEALLGASVFIPGLQTGTTTDIDGNYELNASAPAGTYDVMMSYVGYSTQTTKLTIAAGESSYRIDGALKSDFLRLDEIVVTGASAATSKKNLGNAISTVDSRDIAKSGALGLDQALSGKVTGALVSQNSGNPAGGISVTLRGTSTVFGSSDPLYIIDGVIVDNSSPELVDLGGYAQNRLVDFNPNDIERVEIIKGAAAAAIYGSRASNGVVQIFTKKGAAGKPRINLSTSVQFNSLRKEIEENLEPFRFEAVNDATNTTLLPAERFKMQDYIFDTGVGTDNYLSVSGGQGNTRYFLSGSLYKNEGIVRNTNFDRYTTRVNLEQTLSNWLSIGTGLGYTYSTSNEVPNGGLGEFYGALTGANFNNTDYDPRPDANGNYLSPAGFVANPLEVIETFEFGQNTRRFNGNANIKMTPFKGFSADFVFGFDSYTQSARGFIPVGANTRPTGWARSGIATSLLTNVDLNLRYITDLSENINSTSLLGFTFQHDETQRIAITANNLSPVVNSTDAGTATGLGDSRSERNIQGAYFQQTFGLLDKLYVTGAIRVDAASPFGVDERTQFYPKASVSYVLSEEEFMQDGFFDLLKVRASYGESGNLSALRAYERLSNYNPVPITGQTGLAPSTQLGNPNLRPERQKEIEIGLDLGFLDNRLGLEMTYYDVKVEDLLLTRTLAATTGFSTRLENVGEMINKGFELLLRAAPVQTSKVKWNVTATFSTNQNEVNGIEGNQIALPKSFGVSLARNGEQLGILDGFIYARDANGEIALDDMGLPSRAVDANGQTIRTTIGDPNPDWLGSLINEVEIGNLSFRLQFDAVQGFDIFNFTDRVNSRSRFGGGFRDAQEIRGELPRGFNNAAYNIWERYIEDGSFIKLRELAVNYKVNTNISWLQSLQVYVKGRNLFSFDDYSGWDPETSAAGQQNGVRGFDFNEVPIPRTIQFGINAAF